jgi:hypothetical protein
VGAPVGLEAWFAYGEEGLRLLLGMAFTYMMLLAGSVVLLAMVGWAGLYLGTLAEDWLEYLARRR